MALLFTPPVRSGRLPRHTATQDRVGRRLFRHVVPPVTGVNVFIVDGEATETCSDPTSADAVFLGGRAVPYEVTAAQQTILEAAGYTVVEA